MKKITEQKTYKTYTTKEVRESLDQYLDSSAERLRIRLKDAWGKQITEKQLTHAEAKI